MKRIRCSARKVSIGIIALMAITLFSTRGEASPFIYLRGVPSRVEEPSGFEAVQHEFTAQIVLSGVSRVNGISLELMYNADVMEAVDQNGQTAESLTMQPGLFGKLIRSEVEDPRSVVIGPP